MTSSYETKINSILAEMRVASQPNYLWYSLRLQALPVPPAVFQTQAVARVGKPGPTNDEILRRALGEVSNSMAAKYGLGEHKKEAFVDEHSVLRAAFNGE